MGGNCGITLQYMVASYMLKFMFNLFYSISLKHSYKIVQENTSKDPKRIKSNIYLIYYIVYFKIIIGALKIEKKTSYIAFGPEMCLFYILCPIYVFYVLFLSNILFLFYTNLK